MDIKEIRSIIDLMKKNGLAVFKLEREDFKLTLKTDAAGSPIVQTYAAPAATTPPPASAPAAPATPSVDPDLVEINSPMVGTFYATPSPDAEPYVKAGQKITADSTVCIIEAMKVMNEIKAENEGTVVEVCAEHGKPVQFGQVLYRVK